MRDYSIVGSILSSIIKDLPIAVFICEAVHNTEGIADFKYIYANELAATISAASSKEIVGQTMLELRPDIADTDLLTRYKNVLLTGNPIEFEQFFSAEKSLRGQDVWFAIKAQRHEEFLIVLVENISKRKLLENHIKQMAFQDELTLVYNRRYFVSRTPQLLSLAKRHNWSCGLLYFDLNGFKQVNDEHGHSTGDKLLKQVAWRLSKLSRDQDIFFRSGGDEFALFLPHASEEEALLAARRIAVIFEEETIVDNLNFAIGASIGVAVMPAEEANLDALLERADKAMYKAKERKNTERAPIALWTEALGEEFAEPTSKAVLKKLN